MHSLPIRVRNGARLGVAAVLVAALALLAIPAATAMADPTPAPPTPTHHRALAMGSFSQSRYAAAAARLPAGLVTALQRDLSVTPAEYLADAAAAARAVDVVASLKTVGVHVLGSKIHGTKLTVNVASSADTATVQATGATAAVGAPVVTDYSKVKFHSVTTNNTYGGQGYFYQESNQLGTNNGFRCSIGFNGFSVATGASQFATAGHCATTISGNATLLSSTQPTILGDTSSPVQVLGTTVAGEAQYGGNMDYGIVGEGAPGLSPQPSLYTWGGSTGAPLASAPLSITGQTAGITGATLCKSGSTSGWTCGLIRAVDQSVPVCSPGDAANCPNHLVNSIVATTCLLPGDSGGGAVIGTNAAGIDSGSSYPGTDCNNPNLGNLNTEFESVFFPMVSAAGPNSVAGQQGSHWEPAVSVSTPTVTSTCATASGSSTSSLSGNIANPASNMTVSVYVDGASTPTATTSASSGSWAFTFPSLSVGTHSYSMVGTWGTWSRSAAVTGTFTVSSAGGSAICEQPVYRFYEPQSNDHFYTMSLAERDEIIATFPPSEWTYEGVAFQAFPTQVPGSVPLFRFWSAQFVGHFFTANEGEKNYVIQTYPSSEWNYEGIAFYVYPATWTGAGSAAVYRFWSPNFRQHFYTQSASEKDGLIAENRPNEWTYEGVNFYLPAS